MIKLLTLGFVAIVLSMFIGSVHAQTATPTTTTVTATPTPSGTTVPSAAPATGHAK